MNCAEFDRVFYADLAHGGAAEARAAADRHATGCAACAQKLANERALAAAMGVDAPRARMAKTRLRARKRKALALSLAMASLLAAGALAIHRGALPKIAALATRSPAVHPAPVTPRAPELESPAMRGAPIAAESVARARSAAAAAANDVADASADAAISASAAFDAAMRLYRMARFEDATLAFQSISPPSAEAALWAARSLRASGDFTGAALLFSEVAAAYSRTSVGDDALLETGRCYRALGHVETARAWLRPLRALPTHAARAHEELEGIERDLATARKRWQRAQRAAEEESEAARHAPPVVAPRGIDPTPRAAGVGRLGGGGGE